MNARAYIGLTSPCRMLRRRGTTPIIIYGSLRHSSLPQLATTRLLPQRRYEASTSTSTETGENDSGHISAESNEGILFFDNVFPLRLRWLVRLSGTPGRAAVQFIDRMQAHNPARVVEEAAPGKVEVREALPRIKEGGEFVKIATKGGSTLKEVEELLKRYLSERKIKPWWNPLTRVRANLVRGRPWIEDLWRLPTTRIKVEFMPTSPGAEAVELSQEQLYSFFRPYGKLVDIVSQPPESKILPKYAYVDFAGIRRSIMAKNCLHGLRVSEAEGGGKAGTELRLTFERRAKANWTKDWLFNHPRIMIPLLAALIAGITVAIFDPVRTFFIKAHITRYFNVGDSKIFRWFKAQATDLLYFGRRRWDDAGMKAIWEDRADEIELIQKWLLETSGTFIVVQGPRGSGKRELVIDRALKYKKHKLVIDCKPIQEARGDSATIDAAAKEVGYRPVFSWMNTVSGWIDLAAQGATGMKTGFSETVDNYLAKIWNNTALALKQIALEGRTKNDKDANLSDDEYLEAHPEKRPVVVIDNFLHKSQESSVVYEKIAEWAARLTTSNIAHVIFLTTDVSYSKSLSKALPDRVFRRVTLGDCSPEVAKRFVLTHLDADPDDVNDGGKAKKLPPSHQPEDLDELDQSLSFLGGRLTDLEFLARRIKSGETPLKAVQEIINQTASEIIKMYLFGFDRLERKWTSEQAWLLIKKLASEESIRYNEVLLSDVYKTGGESVLQALEQAELISLVTSNGRPYSIKSGKPVYQHAFRKLTQDRVLRSRLDLAVLLESVKVENSNVEKYENELRLIGKLPKHPPELEPRVEWLLGKLAASQAKIMGYEREGDKLKKILTQEY